MMRRSPGKEPGEGASMEQARAEIILFLRANEMIKRAAHSVDGICQRRAKDTDDCDLSVLAGDAIRIFAEAMLPIKEHIDVSMLPKALVEDANLYRSLHEEPEMTDVPDIIKEIIDRYADEDRDSTYLLREAFAPESTEVAIPILEILKEKGPKAALQSVQNITDAETQFNVFALLIPEIISTSVQPSIIQSLLNRLYRYKKNLQYVSPSTTVLGLRAECYAGAALYKTSSERFAAYPRATKIALFNLLPGERDTKQQAKQLHALVNLCASGEFIGLLPLLTPQARELVEASLGAAIDAVIKSGYSEADISRIIESSPSRLTYQLDALSVPTQMQNLLDDAKDIVDTIDPRLSRLYGAREIKDAPSRVTLIDMKGPVSELRARRIMSGMKLKPAGLAEIIRLHKKHPELIVGGINIVGLADQHIRRKRDGFEIIEWPILSIGDEGSQSYLEMYNHIGDKIFKDLTWRFIAVSDQES